MNLYEVKDKLVAYLGELGFTDTARAYSILRELLDRAPDRPDLVEKVIERCAASASPDQCLLNFSRFVDQSFSPYTQIRDLVENELRGRVAFALFASSNYLASFLIAQPSLLDWLFEGGILRERSFEEMHDVSFALIDTFKEKIGFLEALNNFKVMHNLNVAVRELLKLDGIGAAAKKLSQVADIVLETVYRYERKTYSGSSLTIYALGKLGGSELNFSSDLDLIFVSDGQDDPDLDDFGRAIVSDMLFDTKFGHLFRIDLRLRPEGDYSPIVTRLGYLENYFEERARTWERQAYIRARACAGDPDIAVKADELIRKFVYHSTLTIEDIRSIIFIKDEIDHSVRDNPLGHVKKGRGGIRDIEFIVQAFQLIFGNKLPEFRRANIFQALELLYSYDFFSRDDYGTLSEAYVFLRRIEHYLQLKENRQVFELPESGEELKSLSRLLDFATPEAALRYYEDIRGKVRTIFTRTFSRLFGEGEIAPISEIVMNPEIEESAALKLLEKYRFEDAASVFKYLRRLASYSSRVEYALALSLNFILEKARDYAQPDKKFFNYFSVMEAYGAYSTFLRLTRMSEEWRDLTLDVIASSPELTGIVRESPGLIDAFMDPESFSAVIEPEVLYPAILEIKGGDRKAALERLKNHFLLKTAIRETGGALGPREAGETLAGMADFVIREACGQADGGMKGYCILALGRLGCREYTYGSDADVVFVYDEKTSSQTDYAKFFLDVTKYLKGIVELDARLRPDGSSSPLTVSVEALDDYFRTKDQFFEKAAYFKARVCVCPDDGLRGRVEEVVARFVASGDAKNDAANVAELREKIHKAYTKPGVFDIKKDEGGLLDVDFCLFHAARSGRKDQLPQTTEDRIAALGLDGLLEPYRFYRRLESALRLNYPENGSRLAEGEERYYLPILRHLKLGSTKELNEKAGEMRERIKKVYQEVFG